MYRRRFPGDDIPDRPGTIVEELNPFMTRSQVQSDMEMDRIAEEMREKGRQMRMRQQQGMGARPSDMELRQLQRMDGNTLPFTRSPSNMDMRQLQGIVARPSDMDMSSELDNVAREMRARRRR